MLKANLHLDFEAPYEYASVSFKCGEEKLVITSTSKGSIDGEGNVKIVDSDAEMYLEYCESADNLECLVGFYNRNELMHYETLVTPFDSKKSITETQISIPSIGTIPGSYKTRFTDFRDALKRRVGSWKITMTCPDDILLHFDKVGTSVTLACLGEACEELRASDYVFQIDPVLKQINVPKDLLKRNYELYTPGCNLGIFELIKPDFLAVKNVFYKVLISNTMSLSSFA